MIASYVFQLTATTLTPLAHGETSEGNEQVLRREPLLAWDEGLDDYRELLVPLVSGAALKATLREHAVHRYLATLGVERLGRDRLRLLLKGGRYERGDTGGVNASEQWELRQNCPLLGVFGSMDRGTPNRGCVQVHGLRAWVREAVEAGMQPAHIVDGDGTRPLFADGRGPIRLADATHVEQRFRHDLSLSSMAARLELADGEAAAARQEAVAARREEGGRVGARERRRANESMPYTTETISAGVPMLGEIRLENATLPELWTFQLALRDWILSGARLGGIAREGFGRLAVQVRGAWQLELQPAFTLPPGAVAVDAAPDVQVEGMLAAHLAERRTSILTWLGAP